MKIFISSLIGGFEAYRAAARDAVTQLGYEPVMAEDFPAQPNSPQVACLQGLRESAMVLLVMGERYGAVGRSGVSPTHEEYLEAKGRIPVAAFVQQGVTPDAAQKDFIKDVQEWEGGLLRSGFTTPDQLRGLVTRAIHQTLLTGASSPMNADELRSRAIAQLPDGREGRSSYRRGRSLLVSLAFGPHQTILRPAEMEGQALIDTLSQAALFGTARIFDRTRGTTPSMDRDALVLGQGDGFAQFCIAPTGDMLFHMPLVHVEHVPAVIEENVQATIAATVAFAAAVLAEVDGTQRLTHFAPAVTLEGADNVVWRTQAEQDRSPNSYSMPWNNDERLPVTLTPPTKPRAALTMDKGHMVEDLTVMLRRTWKGEG